MNRKLPRPNFKKDVKPIFFTFGVSLLFVNLGVTAGEVAQSPLFLASPVKPNIMLMMDNSGSMNNVLVETDKGLYNPNTTYQPSCPAENVIQSCLKDWCIQLKINSGVPYIVHGGSEYRLGTSTGQKCFSSTATYSALLVEGANNGDADYNGNYLNWYFDPSTTTGMWTDHKPQTKTRLEVAKAAGNSLIDTLDNVRLGLSAYYGDQGGALFEIVEDVDINSTKKANVKAKIDNLKPENNTPLAETLSDIGQYFTTGFSGSLTLHKDKANESSKTVSEIFTQGNTANHQLYDSTGGQAIVAPILQACQKSFAVLVTDGRPHLDRDVSPIMRDYTGDCAAGLCDARPTVASYPILNQQYNCPLSSDANPAAQPLPPYALTSTCFRNGTKTGRTYEWAGSDYLDDVAQALFEMDLRPDLLKTNGRKNNLITYAIGFADPALENDPLLRDTAIKGGGLFKMADNSSELNAAFKSVIADINNQVQDGSASSLGVSSRQLDTSTKIYQAGFNSDDWSGSLKAFKLNEDTNGNGVLNNGEDINNNGVLDPPGTIIEPAVWSAESTMPAATNRRILSYNPTITTVNKGISFEWANLSGAQKTALDPGAASTSATSSKILDYVRGDQTNESSTGFRIRQTILGDIVNSDPFFVGKTEDYGYSLLPGTEGSSYTTFRTTGKASRTNAIYMGANDGMLHAFNADSGQELFAYVPNAVIPSLNKLSNKDYGCSRSGCLPHEYFVDGAPRADDAYFAIGSGTAKWRTVLLGTTGAGNGKAVFALDVTNPNPSNSNTVSTLSTDNVLWEISASQAPKASDLDDDATVTPAKLGFKNNLGYSIPQPAVVRMQNGRWAAIIANGYNSVNKKAVLFIVDVAKGEIIRSIDTEKGTSTLPNGLSTPFIADTDGDRIADYIYAGDLLGNLWKFDVSSNNASNWGVAFSSGSPASPAPLYTACSAATCTDTNRQPITAKPQVGRHPSGGLMVYFGTGKYYEAGDQIVDSTTQIQSFYGIRDQGNPVSSIGKLEQQSIVAEQAFDLDGNGTKETILRATSDKVVDYAGNPTASPAVPAKQGWYMNLVPPGTGSTIKGERVVSMPVLRGGRIIFVTLIPSTDSCVPGGSSWFMELDAVNGKRLANAPFDVDNNGYVNMNDRIKGLFDADDDGSANDDEVVVSGRQKLDENGNSQGIVKGVTIINCNDGLECKYTSGSNKKKSMFKENPGEPLGRQSWRQIR